MKITKETKLPLITIAICTFNRSSLLDECLKSLTKQSVSFNDFNIIVINNNSTDNTYLVIENYKQMLPNLTYINESTQGLSYARNTAFQNTKTKWISYLDDDAKVPNNYLATQLDIIENYSPVVFGGVYLPWYHYGKPNWYKEHYASNKLKYKKPTILKSPYTLSGGVITFQVDSIIKHGGFRTDIGMNGNNTGYGEETELQLRMRSEGVPLYYFPKLIIYHVVAPYKLNVFWFIKSYFYLGRDTIKIKNVPRSFLSITKNLVIMLITLFINLFYYSIKLLHRNYYYQNWLIDVFKKPVKRLSILIHLAND